jgi:hypothetical protein
MVGPVPGAARRQCELASCGASYVPAPRTKGRPPQRFCSKSCATSWRNAAGLIRKTLTLEQRKTRDLAKARTRRMLLNAVPWDGVTDAEIMERDRWKCGLCKQPVSRAYAYPDLRSPSVDHVLPLSLGGDDTQWNKQAAHLGCNMAKGADTTAQQMPLPFGADLVSAPRYFRPRTPAVPCAVCGMAHSRKRTLHCPLRWCQACGGVIASARANSVLCPGCRSQRAADAAERTLIAAARNGCAADCCTRDVQAHGMCAPHLFRFQRYGDMFADIPVATSMQERIAVAERIREALSDRSPAEAA